VAATAMAVGIVVASGVAAAGYVKEYIYADRIKIAEKFVENLDRHIGKITDAKISKIQQKLDTIAKQMKSTLEHRRNLLRNVERYFHYSLNGCSPSPYRTKTIV